MAVNQKKNTYRGITTKNSQIYVRFKYNGRPYPVKNFTKLYGCTTEKTANDKLKEIKVMISAGQNPFITKCETLDDYFYERLELNRNNGTWREHTCKQYKYFYDSIISNKEPHDKKQRELSIGWKKLDKITYEDLTNLIKSIEHTKGSFKSTLKRILRPIFDEAVKRKEIFENPVALLPVYVVEKKQKVSLRAIDKNLTIARKLYYGIQKYTTRERIQIEQTQMFFTLLLMTGHRYGELLKLEKKDVYMDKNKIISPSSITKTKEEYIFPFPKELYKYFDGIESGLLFPNLKHGSMWRTFQRVIELSDIQLYRDKKISIHDTRSFLLNIMIKDCKVDSMLADACLEHKQSGVIDHYLDFTFKDKKKAFKKYWKKIRQ
jgi:integrase